MESCLLSEFSVLVRQEQFLSNQRQADLSKRQVKISKWVGFGSVVVGALAIIVSGAIAFWVPAHQREMDKRAQIEAVYKNLVTNQDIFLSNSNGLRNLAVGEISALPESYIEDKISDDARKTIQNTFGLIQYRFFLYYIQQTALLNEEIQQIRSSFIAQNTSIIKLNSTTKYLASMGYLIRDEGEEKDTRLDYQMDTECLVYFFEINFPYLTIDGRGKAPECSSGSLNRIFNLGHLPADTPPWLRPLLRRALNDRESGLGDRLIEL